MAPAARSFFIFLSDLNHARATHRTSTQCIRRYATRHPLVRKPSQPIKPRIPEPPKNAPTEIPPPSSGPKSSSSTEPNTQQYPRIMPQFLRDRPTLRSMIFGFICFVPITGFLLMHSPYEPMSVTGPSMSPTLNPNHNFRVGDLDNDNERDVVLVQRWGVNDWRLQMQKVSDAVKRAEEKANIESIRGKGVLAGTQDAEFNAKYKRGQIVVFRTPHDPDKIAVKRVVGLAGDKVKPLAGYSGLEEGEEDVIVPFNHLWVEGDVNDRNKSIDSNWYGPITQELVVGEVKATWSPWWKFWTMRKVVPAQQKWPAREQGRVNENAVWKAAANPDLLEQYAPFENGKAKMMLQLMKEKPEWIQANWHSSVKHQREYRQFWISAVEVSRLPGSTLEQRALAVDVVDAFFDILGGDTLMGKTKQQQQKRTRWTPATEEERRREEKYAVKPFAAAEEVTVHADEEAERKRQEREDKKNPAAAALRQMQQKTRQLSDQWEETRDKRDQTLEAREGGQAPEHWVTSTVFGSKKKREQQESSSSG